MVSVIAYLPLRWELSTFDEQRTERSEVPY